MRSKLRRESRRPINWLVPLLIALATAVAFLPTLQNDFVVWDDDKNFLENPHYRGLGWTQLKWMWTTFHLAQYRPLAWMTLGADYLLWGMNPFGYHLSSLLLHIINAVVLYFLSIRILRLAWPRALERERMALHVCAGMAALLFAIHPLRAEPVAWISARADVLSGLLFMLCITAYLKSCAAPDDGRVRRGWLAGAMVLFVLSLLSKSTSLTLPTVLIVLDVYPLRRLGGGPGRWFGPTVRHVWWEKLPFVALVLTVVPVAFFSKSQYGAVMALGHYDPITGIALALFGTTFYLWKTLVPFGLSPLYELPVRLNPSDWPFLLSATVVLVITGILVVSRRRWPAGLAVWASYIVIAAPTSGIIPFQAQIAADRYTYLSCLGWAILAGGGLLFAWQAWTRGRIAALIWFLILGVALSNITGLGFLTWKQVQVWRDSTTLWTHALSIGPSSLAHNNLGYLAKREGKLTEAMEHFRRALEINPTHVEAHINLGEVLLGRGQINDAIEHFQQALRLKPVVPVSTLADVHANLGYALASQGKVDEAIEHFQEALGLDPAHVNAHNNLGLALLKQGKLTDSIEHLQRAVRIKPDSPEIHANLGFALARQGRLEAAIKRYQQALALKPSFSEVHNNLGLVLMSEGKLPEAINHFRQALQIRPNFSQARSNLEAALSQKDK